MLCLITNRLWFQLRFRTILRRPTDPSANCPPTEDSEACNPEPCDEAAQVEEDVVDCEVTSWAPWSACSKTCGSGIMHRFRVIVRKPRNGGKSCENLEENKPCDAGFCYGRSRRDSFFLEDL